MSIYGIPYPGGGSPFTTFDCLIPVASDAEFVMTKALPIISVKNANLNYQDPEQEINVDIPLLGTGIVDMQNYIIFDFTEDVNLWHDSTHCTGLKFKIQYAVQPSVPCTLIDIFSEGVYGIWLIDDPEVVELEVDNFGGVWEVPEP